MKKSAIRLFCSSFFLAGIFYSCEKEFICPVVITETVSDISQTTAVSGGIVTDHGVSVVTARGVCWSTDQNPSNTDSTTIYGSGAGRFNCKLTRLMSGTLYYVRAYATYEAGTVYGNQESFTTQPGLATVTTSPVTRIAETSALCGGDIVTDGGTAVTERGVCLDTCQNPTVDDAHTPGNKGTGSYACKVTGLQPETTYYVRAYATNSAGTAYGQEVTFKTDMKNNGTFIDTRDNKAYKWVRIGDQVWMAENLAYLPSVSPASEGCCIDPFYYVYGYEGTDVSEAKATANYKDYGVLYNWPAALNACPSGWHLPTDAEWKTLEMYLGMSPGQVEGISMRGTVEGGKLKEAGTMHWISPNTGATNESGFTALPGGHRLSSGSFYYKGYYGSWWSATEFGTYRAWLRYMHSSYSKVYRYDYYKAYGFSVRCLRDETI